MANRRTPDLRHTKPRAVRSRRRGRRSALEASALTWGDEGGRPVLLLHGLPQTPDIFQPLAGRLPRLGFWAIAPYLYGNRFWRRRAPEDYNLGQFVDNAMAVADFLGLGCFDVVGVGMGAAVGWMLAAGHPERVRWMASIQFPHPAAAVASVQWPGLQGTRSPLEQPMRAAVLQTEQGLLLSRQARLRALLRELGLPECHLERYVERLSAPGALDAALAWNSPLPPEELSRLPDVTVPLLMVLSPDAGAAAVPERGRPVAQARLGEVALLQGTRFPLEAASGELIRLLEEHLPRS